MSVGVTSTFIIAREARGMTQAKLAELIGVSQAVISKVENGLQSASPSIVEGYARELGYAPSFFDQQMDVRRLPQHFYRKKARATVAEARRAEATMNVLRMQVRAMLRSAEIPENTIPSLDRAKFDGTPADAARLVRKKWMLPRGPIQNITRLLEDHGIVIVSCDFGTDDIDAMSVQVPGDDMPPCILVSPSAPGDRLRWSLVHELGHLVLHSHKDHVDDASIEAEADEFASEFAMPANDIRPHLRTVTLERLATLKLTWRMSIASMIMAARRLGLIQERWERTLWIGMSRNGWRVDEPNHVPRDEPALIGEVVTFFRKNLEYSEQQMAAMLHTSVTEFRASFGGNPAGGLRIVKF
ncbi:MAG: ImmA/IrrE family metallo-endopeptidase [Polyangiales bacterium]